jgi:type 1 glutamine amidotransferase
LFTGFDHWVIPHADAVINILSEKTGAYEVVKSNDISMFEKKSLKQYDAVVLNNNCSVGPKRDLFYDALGKIVELSEEEKVAKAAELEANLLTFVKKGGGLAVLHGGIVMQNNSAEMSEMVGGSFDYHPPQQKIELQLAEKDHPLTKAFEGSSFTHIDEPYFFKNAYAKKDFRPMLYMEISKIQKMRHETEDKVSYVSWIKKYGKGRVFYVSPSHNAQSYESTRILTYYLNGMQYVLGDLKCDDAPLTP